MKSLFALLGLLAIASCSADPGKFEAKLATLSLSAKLQGGIAVHLAPGQKITVAIDQADSPIFGVGVQVYPDSIPAEFDDAVLVLVPGNSFVAQITSDLQSLGPAFSIRLLALLSDQDIALNSRISVFSTLVNLSDDPQAREVDDYVLAQRFGDSPATIPTGIYGRDQTISVDTLELGLFEVAGFRVLEPVVELGGTGLSDCYDNWGVIDCLDAAMLYPNQDAARGLVAIEAVKRDSMLEVGDMLWTFLSVDSGEDIAIYRGNCEGLDLDGHVGWHVPSVLEYMAAVDFERMVAFPSSSTTGSYLPADQKILLNEMEVVTDGVLLNIFGAASFESTNAPIQDLTSLFDLNRIGCAYNPRRSVDDKHYWAFENGFGDVKVHNATGTVWAGENKRLAWREALQYCDKLEMGGRRDWVLPNAKEVLAASFLGSEIVHGGSLWTSTTVQGMPTNAYVYSTDGYGLNPGRKTDNASVACVSVK